MKIKTEDAERLMKRCQIGVGGRNARDTAHSIMAECYGTIGALVQERDSLLMAPHVEVLGRAKELEERLQYVAAYLESAVESEENAGLLMSAKPLLGDVRRFILK